MKTIKFLGIVSMLLLFLVLFDVHAQDTMPDKLYLVRKIYIGEIEDIDKEKRINSFLKQELEARGFTVVDDSVNADAVLSGRVEGELPLDDYDPSWLKSTFEFRLISQGKEKVWERRIRIHSMLDVARDAKNGARKIAERLEGDWKKSAKKAGLNTGK